MLKLIPFGRRGKKGGPLEWHLLLPGEEPSIAGKNRQQFTPLNLDVSTATQVFVRENRDAALEIAVSSFTAGRRPNSTTAPGLTARNLALFGANFVQAVELAALCCLAGQEYDQPSMTAVAVG